MTPFLRERIAQICTRKIGMRAVTTDAVHITFDVIGPKKSNVGPDATQYSSNKARYEQRIEIEKDGQLRMNYQILEEIFHVSGISDKNGCLISIVGLQGTGKSFLLNYLMRYLRSLEHDKTDKWIGEEEEPLEGFSWSHSEQPTTGDLVLWTKSFIITDETGKEVHILLMDTKGLTNEEKNETDKLILNYLADLSTVVITNLMTVGKKVETDHVGRMSELLSSTPLKKKHYILVRDHKKKQTGYQFGSTSGKQFLSNITKAARKIPDDTECYLLPVASGKITIDDDDEYNGCQSGLSDNFRTHIEVFFSSFINDIRNMNSMTGEELVKALQWHLSATADY